MTTDTRLIDLHAHTTASDGSLSPRELVQAAKEAGLTALAICDHDTTAGIAEATATGKELGVEIVPSVEISALYEGGTMHILGYYSDIEDERFQERLRDILDGRNNRNPRVIARLNELGIDITLDDVIAEADGGVIGRPHMARALLKKGAVSTLQEAFDEYLASGGKAFILKEKYPPEACVRMIVEAGGVPVLAHPKQLRRNTLQEIENVVDELVKYGLAGIEIIHGECEPERIPEYEAIARSRGLLLTGGSDFHGASKPDILLGRGRHDYRIPYTYLDAIKARHAETAA